MPSQRQVIVEGKVRELSQAESEPYYRSRPRLSQIGAWASRQSTVIASRAVLDDRVAELERRWPEPGEVPMPDFWGGYLLEPDAVEFWQAGAFRLHDRLRYRRTVRGTGEVGGGWAVDRLSPDAARQGCGDSFRRPFGPFAGRDDRLHLCAVMPMIVTILSTSPGLRDHASRLRGIASQAGG